MLTELQSTLISLLWLIVLLLAVIEYCPWNKEES